MLNIEVEVILKSCQTGNGNYTWLLMTNLNIKMALDLVALWENDYNIINYMS